MKQRAKLRTVEILNLPFAICHLSFVIRYLSFSRRPGHIAAKRFFCQKITGGLIGSGPATAAHPLKFTGAALAFEPVIIA